MEGGAEIPLAATKAEKDNSINQGDTIAGNVGLDCDSAAMATEPNEPQPKTGGNGCLGQGSRFGVLSDKNEMDMDTGESVEDVGIGSNPTVNSKEMVAGEEVVMETLEVDEGGCSRVNISVPLAGTKMSIQTQAQGDGTGPRKNNGKVFKDLTNKLDVRHDC